MTHENDGEREPELEIDPSSIRRRPSGLGRTARHRSLIDTLFATAVAGGAVCRAIAASPPRGSPAMAR